MDVLLATDFKSEACHNKPREAESNRKTKEKAKMIWPSWESMASRESQTTGTLELDTTSEIPKSRQKNCHFMKYRFSYLF